MHYVYLSPYQIATDQAKVIIDYTAVPKTYLEATNPMVKRPVHLSAPILYSDLRDGDFIQDGKTSIIFEEFFEDKVVPYMDRFGTARHLPPPAKRRQIADVLLPPIDKKTLRRPAPA